jgi:hypothetical protein
LWSYIICVLVDGFRSFNDATDERVSQGSHFSLRMVSAVKMSHWPNENELSHPPQAGGGEGGKHGELFHRIKLWTSQRSARLLANPSEFGDAA